MKKLILAILLSASQVLAQSAPPSVKGQSATGYLRPKPNLQVPYNQATNLGGLDALLETGYENLLLNPNYEAIVSTTSWTLGTGVTASAASNVQSGKKAITLTLASANGLILSQDVTPTIKMSGKNMEYGFWLLNTAITTLQVCARQGGVTVGICAPVGISPDYQWYPVNYPGPASGSIGVSLFTTGSTSGTVDVDNAYVGMARNVGSVAQATYFGGMNQAGATGCTYAENTSSGLNNFVDYGTASGCNAWTTDGSVSSVGTNDHRISVLNVPPGVLTVELKGDFNSSVSQACFTRLSDGTNTYEAQVSNGPTPIIRYHVPIATAQSLLTYKLQASDNGAGACQIDNSAAGLNLSWKVYYFPSQAQQAVQMSQTNFDWTTCPTMTGSWSTNTTYSCLWKRQGSNALFQVKASTSGAPDNVALTLNLPVTIDVLKIPVLTANRGSFGSSNFDDAGTSVYPGIVAYNSTTSVAVLAQGSGGSYVTGNVVSATVPFTLGAGDSVVANFSVPVSGWIENQNAPLLVGGVTTTSMLGNIEWAMVIGACTSSPCTIASQSGGFTSITRAATGDYFANFPSGKFSATPACIVWPQSTAGLKTSAPNPVSATSFGFGIYNPSAGGVRVDDGFILICPGAK